jgi:hypothetical protein
MRTFAQQWRYWVKGKDDIRDLKLLLLNCMRVCDMET